MILGLADVSCISLFSDFDETVTYGKNTFYGRIKDDFSVFTIDSTTADNYESTLGTGTNDLENDTGAYKNLYFWPHSRISFVFFGNAIRNGNFAANISGCNCAHKSCVEYELLSNFDNGTNSNCDTCSTEDKTIRLDCMKSHSISVCFVDCDHTCQPFFLRIIIVGHVQFRILHLKIWWVVQVKTSKKKTFRVPKDLVSFVRKIELCCESHSYIYNIHPISGPHLKWSQDSKLLLLVGLNHHWSYHSFPFVCERREQYLSEIDLYITFNLIYQ